MKSLSEIYNLIESDTLTTKVYLYFSTKTEEEDFDPYEKNYTTTNLNPVCIKAYVHEIEAEKLVWKQYGLQSTGAKELICRDKYIEWFKNASRIVIEDEDYEVYKEGVGGNAIITKRQAQLIRVILRKKG